MVRVFGNRSGGVIDACFGMLLISVVFLMVSRFGTIEAAAGTAVAYMYRLTCRKHKEKIRVQPCPTGSYRFRRNWIYEG